MLLHHVQIRSMQIIDADYSALAFGDCDCNSIGPDNSVLEYYFVRLNFLGILII